MEEKTRQTFLLTSPAFEQAILKNPEYHNNISYLEKFAGFPVFKNSTGLDEEGHYSSAYDLALLTDYALNNTTFKKMVSTKRITINFNGYQKELINTNELLDNQKRNIRRKNWFYI